MRFSRLSFLTASLMTIAIVVIVILFDDARNNVSQFEFNLTYLLIITTVLIFIVTFFGIETLFSVYGKRQLKKMAENIPEVGFQVEDLMGFKELSEKISDIKKESESELDLLKEMEVFRKEYVGNISHELKTPLFSIQGYVETLLDGASENPVILGKYLDRIGISVERLINIVNDLDMINQFEADEIKLNITTFDLNSLIREVFDLLEIEAQKKGAILKLVPALPQIFVEADKQKISQVLINLVSNAIHYSNRQEATIKITTAYLKNKVMVEVADNGMGIKPDALPRIFERFYRVETSRNRKDGGSGLGLAIVKHILEGHGETITVASEYLEGTKFNFLLKKAKEIPKPGI